LAGLTRGAIVEPGDGELVIPGVLQPLAQLPSPVARMLGSGLTFNDSFFTSFTNAVLGAQAGATNVLCNLSKGLWSIRWYYDAMFLGTTSVIAASQLNFLDHVGSNSPIKVLRHFNGRQIADNGELTILMQDDGWHLDSVLGATIAGDSLTTDIAIYGARLM
jgi:hypothetical protein